jgi:hypothetical protein
MFFAVVYFLLRLVLRLAPEGENLSYTPGGRPSVHPFECRPDRQCDAQHRSEKPRIRERATV